MGRPVVNKYSVPLKQWKRWSNQAKRVFNDMYQELRPRAQWRFLHPQATPVLRRHWETTRWNVAWTAANAVNRTPYTHIVPVDAKGKKVGKARRIAK
jgi:hypothetical protein